MPSKELANIREAKPHLISDAKRLLIARTPKDLAEAQERINVLTKAIVAIADHCADLHKALLALSDEEPRK